MLIDINNKEIYITLDELISFSFPSGSLAKTPDFYEKPKTAVAICESIADENDRYMLSHAFSASYEVDGYTYTVTAAPDLCAVYNDHAELINVQASGGRTNAPQSLIAIPTQPVLK